MATKKEIITQLIEMKVSDKKTLDVMSKSELETLLKEALKPKPEPERVLDKTFTKAELAAMDEKERIRMTPNRPGWTKMSPDEADGFQKNGVLAGYNPITGEGLIKADQEVKNAT